MAGYQELIKDFEKIRRYMLDFYIYGFRRREEFSYKSTRTYDNERRRIESYLGDYVKQHISSTGKQFYITMDCAQLNKNPLYSAWKSKSFTNNDIVLHFYLLEILSEEKKYTISEIVDELSEKYGVLMDVQAVRAKCKEYETVGLLCSEKQGKTLYYQKVDEVVLPNSLIDAIRFYQGEAPFGVIGSFLLDHEEKENDFFFFKHQFIVHTLEDEVLLKIVRAIQEKRTITFHNIRNIKQENLLTSGMPLYISVSTQTGRRYVCLYNYWQRRFASYRLDYLTNISIGEKAEEWDYFREKVENQRKNSWGVSFGNKRQRPAEICVKFFIDERREPYVLERLEREGRGGEIIRTAENTFVYSKTLNDAGEIMPWIKTFTGRILEFNCTDRNIEERFYMDIKKMQALYGKEK